MFPSQSITITKDIHSGTFGLFSATTTVPRYILYTSGNCNSITDNAITMGLNSPLGNHKNVLDMEDTTSEFVYNPQNTLWNVGDALYWYKERTGDMCFFQVTYIDVASTTTSTVQTETATTTFPYSYHDWLFINGVQIFFLSFIGIAMIFSAFTRR